MYRLLLHESVNSFWTKVKRNKKGHPMECLSKVKPHSHVRVSPIYFPYLGIFEDTFKLLICIFSNFARNLCNLDDDDENCDIDNHGPYLIRLNPPWWSHLTDFTFFLSFFFCSVFLNMTWIWPSDLWHCAFSNYDTGSFFYYFLWLKIKLIIRRVTKGLKQN